MGNAKSKVEPGEPNPQQDSIEADEAVFVQGKNEVEEVDYGEHIIRGENNKKILRPNIKYTTDEGYEYTTDSKGRITDVRVSNLILEKGERNLYAQSHVGGEDRLSDDDGGHLIGTQFHGSGDIDNLLPQNSKVNRSGGEWYKMETEWKNALIGKKEPFDENPPNSVEVSINVVFPEDSSRPEKYIVNYVVRDKDGNEISEVKKSIDNKNIK